MKKESEHAGVLTRGRAYVDAIKAAAEERGDGYWLDAFEFQAIQRRFPVLPPMPEPDYASLPTRGLRLMARMAVFLGRGLPVRTIEEQKTVESICLKCPGRYWYADGNFGMGQCTHPGCGCGKFKWMLKTEKCPIGLW